MPRLTALAVRASLVHLVAGFTFGGLLLANKGLQFEPALWGLLPAHAELLTIGWLAQLAMAVGYWILPRFSGSRGAVELAWLSIVLLNLGLIISAFGPIIGFTRWAPTLGWAAIVMAVALFGVHAWPRIKAPGA